MTLSVHQHFFFIPATWQGQWQWQTSYSSSRWWRDRRRMKSYNSIKYAQTSLNSWKIIKYLTQASKKPKIIAIYKPKTHFDRKLVKGRITKKMFTCLTIRLLKCNITACDVFVHQRWLAAFQTSQNALREEGRKYNAYQIQPSDWIKTQTLSSSIECGFVPSSSSVSTFWISLFFSSVYGDVVSNGGSIQIL